jgi:CheY-like chemotaxis protein/nitrogen-specific signal transduction histidine kinase
MPKTRKSVAKRVRRSKHAPPRRRAPAPNARAIKATLAELAHDIRTPLTGILALGELLAASALGERERGWAVAIKSTAEHLALVTSLIVDAARADAKGLVLRREHMQPRRFADALAASFTARAETKGLEAEIAIADDLPEAVIGDSLRLRAALENLIDNAVKFTERGRVRLDVTSEKASRGRGRLVFTVSDSGIGLNPAEIKRLFRPFAQASARIARRYGGAGLGLASVKRIAKAMGGDLTVASERGGGSRFRLTVTVAMVAEVVPVHGDSAAAVLRAAPARPLNILCAEDNPYGRVLLNTILTELGHRADFVATSEAAVAAVAGGSYDAVLMDVTLPGADGLEATRQIRALAGAAGGIPIVGISGRANAADEAAARSVGMDGFLAKPLGPSALSHLLGSLTSRS